MVHQTDNQDQWDQHWRPSQQYPDRMAGSIVNARVPWMFSTSAVGFVLRPSQLGSGIIRCSYSRDGNSMGSYQGCGYGAMWGGDQIANMMREQERSHHWYGACAPNVGASDRNGCQYNEVVLDGNKWLNRLPNLIEAVFYPVNCHVDHREGDRWKAQRVQAYFSQRYGIDTYRTPLLKYDCGHAREGREPFTLA